MKLDIESIVNLLQIKGMGRRTAFKVCNKLDFSPTANEWFEVLRSFSDKYPNVRMPLINKMDIEEAFKKTTSILERSEKEKVNIVSFFDAEYPESLKSIADPPLVINVKGDVNKLNILIGVAVIGTRMPSEAGQKASFYFSKLLAEMGFNIVSGLAKGCDTAAHEGCLQAKGTTTAVLAHGLQTIYPKENKDLAERILGNGGILLSEYLIGTGSLSNYFVERDRLQSGLSKATIVIQTAEKGGSMHAVRATLNGKKRLAAVKYGKRELLHEKTTGNEILIQKGEAFSLNSSNLMEFVNSFYSTSSTPFSNITNDSKPLPPPQLKLEF